MSRWPNLVRLVGLPALLLVLAGCASHKAAQPGQAGGASVPPHTVTKTFTAYRPDGDLAVRVADIAPGRCWTTSIAAPGAHAYRCIAGDEILDPCFAPAKPQTPLEVACVADPWSDAEVLQLSGGLPKTQDGATGTPRPWALVLQNGVRCVAATGTVPAVHGVNLDYQCRDGWDAALINTSRPLASADYANPRTQALRPVGVATIWRG